VILTATVLRADGSVLLDGGKIEGEPAKRGEGHVLWRGRFTARQSGSPDVRIGETMYLQLGDRGLVGVVVTDVSGAAVHFRSRGRMPVPKREGTPT